MYPEGLKECEVLARGLEYVLGIYDMLSLGFMKIKVGKIIPNKLDYWRIFQNEIRLSEYWIIFNKKHFYFYEHKQRKTPKNINIYCCSSMRKV